MTRHQRRANAIKREATEQEIHRTLTKSGKRQRFMIAAGLCIGGTMGAMTANQASPEEARTYGLVSAAFALSAGFITVGEYAVSQRSAMRSVMNYRAQTGQTNSPISRLQVSVQEGKVKTTETKDEVAQGKGIAQLYPQLVRPMATMMCIGASHLSENLSDFNHGEAPAIGSIAVNGGLVALASYAYGKIPQAVEGRMEVFQQQLNNIDGPVNITRFDSRAQN